MNRFSLYELLSYLVPGLFLLVFANFYLNYVFGLNSFIKNSNLEVNLLYLFGALFLGVVFHAYAFKHLGLKWVRNLIYFSVDKHVKKDQDLKKVKDYLKDYLKTEELDVEDYFDLGYYYLETNNQISMAKSFQSIYFWLRNTFFLMLCLSVIQILLGIIFWIVIQFDNIEYNVLYGFVFFGITLCSAIILIKPIKFYRGKMIDRVLWSYYSILVQQHSKSKHGKSKS
jgi:hypothetical protein